MAGQGETWAFAASSLVGEGTTESEIVELQHATPPTLMFNHRSLYAKTRYSSLSTDMGLHWHDFGPVPSLPDPGCKGGIAAWPSHKALLFTNVSAGDMPAPC